MLRLLAVLALLWPALAHAEVTEIRITKQPGIIYLPNIVMEQQALVEKEAARLGMPDLKTRWVTFGGGGAAIDALLSGNVDVVTTGASNMLLAWDRTKGQVKGLAGSSSTPMWFISADPSVKTLRDLKPTDKIAVPTVKISSQAILLQIAARQLYGDAHFDHFDTMTMTLGHPDAQAQLTSGRGGGLTGHFSGAPFQAAEADAPGLHVVTTSEDILGSRFSNAVYFAGTKFYDANPTVIKAFMKAAQDAADYIIANPREACELYVKVTGDKTPVDVLLAQIGDPARNFSLVPAGMMRVANHMADIKVLKTRPADWKEFFFPVAYGLAGE